MRAFPARIRKHARFHVIFDLFDIAFSSGREKKGGSEGGEGEASE